IAQRSPHRSGWGATAMTDHDTPHGQPGPEQTDSKAIAQSSGRHPTRSPATSAPVGAARLAAPTFRNRLSFFPRSAYRKMFAFSLQRGYLPCVTANHPPEGGGTVGVPFTPPLVPVPGPSTQGRGPVALCLPAWAFPRSSWPFHDAVGEPRGPPG